MAFARGVFAPSGTQIDSIPTMKRAALIILDGWGLAPPGPGNCIELARTPVIDRIKAVLPSTTLLTSGLAVGLPEGQMGNSEVGHLTLGAGRVLRQDLVRIGDAIEDGSIFDMPVLEEALERAPRVHILGLCSDGGVHSDITHLEALGEAARRAGKQFYFHAFTDGRDVSPTSGAGHVARLEKTGPVATVCGRYYAMDRDQRWERTGRAFDALVKGNAPRVASASGAVAESYQREVTDEFVEPVRTSDVRIESGDLVIFANFRADRARQLTQMLTVDDGHPDVEFLQMTRYRDDFPGAVLFPREKPADVFGAVCAANGVANLRVAETEKYAHVTYFFNGGHEAEFEGEDRRLVASPQVATYDLQPEMSAPAVARAGAEGIESGAYRALVLNFANPDMVGHTGVIDAAILACESVDRCLGELLAAAETHGWSALITADHGNAEQLIDPETGGPHTAHTTNPVPCWLLDDSDARLRSGGSLQDVAPTLLGLLGIEKPDAMTGQDLRA